MSLEYYEMLKSDLQRLQALYAKAVAERRWDRITRLGWQIRELEILLGEQEELLGEQDGR